MIKDLNILPLVFGIIIGVMVSEATWRIVKLMIYIHRSHNRRIKTDNDNNNIKTMTGNEN